MKTLQPADRPTWLSESAWPWPTRTLSTKAGQVAVTDIGDGPPLLFVHVGAWKFVWRDVLRRLESDFRCVAVDPPGCGLSARLQLPPTLAQATAAVTDTIDALQLQGATMVAHDLGGPVGFAAASRRADCIAALAAINCFAWKPRGAMFRGMLAVMGSAAVRETDSATAFLPRMMSSRFGVGRHLDDSDRCVFRAGIDRKARRAWHGYFRAARYADPLYTELAAGLREELSDRPLLTIFGQRNDPLGFQPTWKALFPNAQQLQVPRGNHFPMCDDHDLVAHALAELTSRT